MGVTLKVYIVEDDDRLRSIPLKQFEGLLDAVPTAKPLPEYADRKIRCVSLAVKMENRKPVAAGRICCHYLCLDESDRVKQEFWESEKRAVAEALSAMILPSKNRISNVIEADRIFNEKRRNHEFKWTPTPEIEKAVLRAVFAEKKPVKKPPLRLV